MALPYSGCNLPACVPVYVVMLVFGVAEFSRCGKEMGFLLPFKCRKENNAMKNCMASWLVAATEVLDNYVIETILQSPVVRWQSGIVTNIVGHINEVNQC